jgi:predicted lipase
MNLLDIARLTKAAYSNEVEGKALAEKLGLSYVLFEVENHNCAVFWNEFETVCAFRGTDSFDDLWSNLKSDQVACRVSPGLVHEGYNEAAWSLIPLIKPLLEGRAVFCGHSMGGALAVIAGAALKPECVYTFNTPKVGSKIFADNYSVPIFRFASIDDPVQSYPSDVPEWAHVGNKITLESKGHSMDDIVRVLS